MVIAILIPVLVGISAALLTRNQMMIYEEITSPPLSPPAILFPIVWTVLYILMGIGSGLIYLSDTPAADKIKALSIYALQLFINFIWSLIFFNAQAFFAAFVLIIILWVLVLKMIIKFYKINKTAGFLQIPYLFWITFATYLTLAIAILNN